MQIDLNCDLGEGCPFDAELMPLITSANIACGFHAGDAATAFTALSQAARHRVAAGAHPSFPDRDSFGRKEMDRLEQQIFEDCVYQIGALAGLARAVGIGLSHVKPHGALYNMACREERYARPIVAAAVLFGLPIVALPDSHLQTACASKVAFVAEGFADRRYLPDGSLVPRSRPDAFVENPAEAVEQGIRLVHQKGIRTLCVHGDNPQALAFVRAVRKALEAQGIAIGKFV
jgi:UPF0271 protein